MHTAWLRLINYSDVPPFFTVGVVAIYFFYAQGWLAFRRVRIPAVRDQRSMAQPAGPVSIFIAGSSVLDPTGGTLFPIQTICHVVTLLKVGRITETYLAPPTQANGGRTVTTSGLGRACALAY